ncbi:MAG: AraC family transcriptional regulator [Paludibacteraceae bacterium]|nr:AraC family transcriptional regulator [Paludibacteraceae bacterium]
MNSSILFEIPPLSDKDVLYIVERYKREFSFPIHKHNVCELNFVYGGEGLNRIVGDSTETIPNLDLVLIVGPVEHAWEQGVCTNDNIREISIQFELNSILPPSLQDKNQYLAIRRMMEKAKKGLVFSQPAIMRVFPLLEQMLETKENFDNILLFLTILNTLARDESSRILSSGAFSQQETKPDSRRVQKIMQYVENHYFEDIRLSDIARLINMTPVSLARFFQRMTGQPVFMYVKNVRLGHASRLLVDTSRSISEIAYSCGFNNLSNFNRQFKAVKGITPKDFRRLYKKNKMLI